MPAQSARQNVTNSELDAKKIVTHLEESFGLMKQETSNHAHKR